jgi:hypothetical protein
MAMRRRRASRSPAIARSPGGMIADCGKSGSKGYAEVAHSLQENLELRDSDSISFARHRKAFELNAHCHRNS